MQNDFCGSGGYVENIMHKDVAAATAMLPALRSALDAARTLNVPVVWIRADYSHQAIPRSMLAKQLSQGITEECCKAGSWGADWYGVAPLAHETVITKHTYSGFHDTELDATLQRLRIETVVFVGVQTQICIESTLREAHSRGYYCVVAEDAVASHSPTLHDATLNNVRFLLGDVCSSAAIIEAWQAGPAASAG